MATRSIQNWTSVVAEIVPQTSTLVSHVVLLPKKKQKKQSTIRVVVDANVVVGRRGVVQTFSGVSRMDVEA